MRMLYGSSADAIASQEMGRDSARDQRFFQSIAAQRAAQQQLDSELYRQASFQAQQQQQAQQAARQDAQLRRLYSKQQQDLELGMERVGAQRDLGMERNRFLEAKMLQDRDLAEGRMGLMAERNQFLSERTNPSDARLQLAEDERKAEEAEIQQAAQRYQQLQSERALLRGTGRRLDEVYPEQQRQFVSSKRKALSLDPFDWSGNYADKFAASKEEELRPFYPPGLPEDYTKRMSLDQRIKLARPEVTDRLTRVEKEIEALDKLGIPQYLNRAPAQPAPPSNSGMPLGGGASPTSGIAPARVIADAQAAIASGKDPALVIRKAQEKFGVDLTPYLR